MMTCVKDLQQVHIPSSSVTCKGSQGSCQIGMQQLCSQAPGNFRFLCCGASLSCDRKRTVGGRISEAERCPLKMDP